ncbi:MAG: lipopolysaccharide heptosyltransferase II [Candidatus Auribacterota bacterium]|jgi:lipopolysaccharide heptosyltransferase I|nr:lipopolysaccharide heptosyltransferase II [Candidatus Auribacterota bacterium]
MKLKGNEKILIIKPSALGDVLHALAVAGEIKKVYPDVCISWVVNREYAELLDNNPVIDKVYVFERRKWGRKRRVLKTASEFLKLIQSVRNAHYDCLIDLQGLLRSGLITIFSGAKIKIGLSDAREGSRLAYKHLITVHDKKRHAVDRYLKTVRYFGIEPECPNRIAFPLKWNQSVNDAVEQIFRNHGLTDGSLKIALNPNARWDTKCWPFEYFAQLADMLYEKMNAQIVFVGSPSDRSNIDKILSAMNHKPVDAVGKTSLLELAALLARMDCLVTNDSGPMHMSVAVGTPVVALFGPTDPAKTGPYGEGHVVIQKELACGACMKRSCLNRQCMSDITVEEVFEHVENLISDHRKYTAGFARHL